MLPGCRTLYWVLIASAVSTAARGEESGWREVTVQSGIHVFLQEDQHSGFPRFRATGIVAGDPFELLSVLADFARYPEWIPDFKVRLLRKKSLTRYVYHGRSEVPWPLRDRDAVYESCLELGPDRRAVRVRFQSVQGVLPPVPGVVRMPTVSGHYQLQRLDDGWTQVDYELAADPAGIIPRWLAALAVRRLPLNTLLSLRHQVARTKGRYVEQIAAWRQLASSLPSTAQKCGIPAPSP